MPSPATDVRLSIAVQHHPRRAALLPRLLASVPDAEIVSDPEPDGLPCPLRTYAEALRRTPAGATHRLILQDDTTVCPDFRARAESAVAEHADTIVCLFVPGLVNAGSREIAHAAARGERFAQLRTAGRIVPAVATVWPTLLAADFLRFLENTARHECSDDGMAGAFVRSRRLDVWATVPSLVQHPDIVPSLIGRKASAGGNRGRVAALYE